MNRFRRVLNMLVVIVFPCFVPFYGAAAADIPVYKGELRILLPGPQSRNSLLLQYRTRTREVLRIGTRGMTLTNIASNEVLQLQNRSAGLTGQSDDADLVTDIVYDGLKLTKDKYRIEGSLIVYLAGSQQTRNFSIYLTPESSAKPPVPVIDWGINNQRDR